MDRCGVWGLSACAQRGRGGCQARMEGGKCRRGHGGGQRGALKCKVLCVKAPELRPACDADRLNVEHTRVVIRTDRCPPELFRRHGGVVLLWASMIPPV